MAHGDAHARAIQTCSPKTKNMEECLAARRFNIYEAAARHSMAMAGIEDRLVSKDSREFSSPERTLNP
jgi:hypothetical protein